MWMGLNWIEKKKNKWVLWWWFMIMKKCFINFFTSGYSCDRQQCTYIDRMREKRQTIGTEEVQHSLQWRCSYLLQLFLQTRQSNPVWINIKLHNIIINMNIKKISWSNYLHIVTIHIWWRKWTALTFKFDKKLIGEFTTWFRNDTRALIYCPSSSIIKISITIHTTTFESCL
jgi:hypothetical protein